MPSEDRGSLYLQLPEFSLSNLLPSVTDVDLTQGHTFALLDKAQALRHASYLLRILAAAAVPEQGRKQRSASFDKHLPWLVDSLEALNEEQKRWKDLCTYAPGSLLELTLSLANSVPGVDHILAQKMDAIIVLIAADVAELTNETREMTGDDSHHLGPASKTLALALVHLAHASIKKRPIAKLAAAQLLKKLDWLITDGRIRDGGDLKVRSPMLYFNRLISHTTLSARYYSYKEL